MCPDVRIPSTLHVCLDSIQQCQHSSSCFILSAPPASVCCPLQHHLPSAATFSTTCDLNLLHSIFTVHSASELAVTCSHVWFRGNLTSLCMEVDSVLNVPLLSW